MAFHTLQFDGETVSDYLPDLAEIFAGKGLNTLFIEYREYGDSTGDARLAAMLGDGEAVLEAAGLAPERTIAFGRSIGALYAIELVNRLPSIAGLIIDSGIADLVPRFLDGADLAATGFDEAEVHAEFKRLFDHEQKLSGYQGPLLVLHTENDGLLDISNAERVCDWAGGDQKRLVRFAVGNHNSIMTSNVIEYFEAVDEFLELVRGA